MFIEELKRICKNKYFIISYIGFIIVLISLLLITLYINDSGNRVSIYLIDNEKSRLSQEYISRLKESDLLSIVEEGDEIKLLNTGKIDAILEIPDGFFTDFKSKLKFTSKSDDLVSAAIIDTIAEKFIPDLGRYMLDQKVEFWIGSKYVKDSIIEYDKRQQESKFELKISNVVSDNITGIKGEYKEKKIAKAKNFFMYSLIFLSILLIINLNMISIFRTKIMQRIKISKIGKTRYYLYSNAISLLLITIPVIIITIITKLILNLTTSSLLSLLITTLIQVFIIYLIIQIVFFLIKRDEYAFSLSLLIIILLGIVGGAFFDIDMMPKAIVKLFNYTPFASIYRAFYSSIIG